MFLAYGVGGVVVLVLLFACGGVAELAGLIDHAIGRGRRAVVLDSNAEWAGKQSKQKKIFLRGFPLHQLQRHFFCFGFTIPRCFFLSILSSLQLYNTIGILLPLAATAQHCTA